MEKDWTLKGDTQQPDPPARSALGPATDSQNGSPPKAKAGQPGKVTDDSIDLD